MAVRTSPTGPEPASIEVDLGARTRARPRAALSRRLGLGGGEALRALAAGAGVAESFVSQVERGVASPSIASVQRIARALDTSIAELFAAPEAAGAVGRARTRR